MMTKEECKFALQRLYSLKNGVRNLYPIVETETLLDSITNDRELLEQLIEEHFELIEFHNRLKEQYKTLSRKNRKLEKTLYFEEKQRANIYVKYKYCLKKYIECKEELKNSPLKWEELKKGMWVWDSRRKFFLKITRVEIDKWDRCFVHYWHDIKKNITIRTLFEENRFYRKQVEE